MQTRFDSRTLLVLEKARELTDIGTQNLVFAKRGLERTIAEAERDNMPERAEWARRILARYQVEWDRRYPPTPDSEEPEN